MTRRGLAAGYLAAVVLAAAGITLGALRAGSGELAGHWPAFAAFAVVVAGTQLFPVRTRHNQCYHLTPAFLVAAVFVLPLALLLLLPAIQHLPEQVLQRYPPHIQLFNAANYTLDLAVASGVAAGLGALGAGNAGVLVPAAGVAFVVVNHLLLAVMLRLARGHSLRTSGLFGREALATDLALAGIGVALLAVWHVEPWLVLLGLVPLLLVHRLLVGWGRSPEAAIT